MPTPLSHTPDTLEEQSRRRMMIGIGVAALVLTAVYAVVYSLDGLYLVTGSSVILFAGYLYLLRSLRAGAPLDVCGSILLSAGLGHLLLAITLDGGGNSTVMSWLPMFPLAAAVLSSRKGFIGFTVASVLVSVVFGVLMALDVDFVERQTLVATGRRLANFLFQPLMVAWLAYTFLEAQRRIRVRLEASSDELQRETEDRLAALSQLLRARGALDQATAQLVRRIEAPVATLAASVDGLVRAGRLTDAEASALRRHATTLSAALEDMHALGHLERDSPALESREFAIAGTLEAELSRLKLAHPSLSDAPLDIGEDVPRRAYGDADGLRVAFRLLVLDVLRAAAPDGRFQLGVTRERDTGDGFTLVMEVSASVSVGASARANDVEMALVAQYCRDRAGTLAPLADDSGWRMSFALAPARNKSRLPCVLVVDDNAVNREVAAEMLDRLGYEVRLLASGVEALREYVPGDYVAVLMDLRMPGLDGVATVRRLRELEPEGHRVPIIALTAHSESEERDRVFGAGMDHFLTKPLSMEPLQAALDMSPSEAEVPDPQVPLLDPSRVDELESIASGLLERLVGAYLEELPRRVVAIQEAALVGDSAAIEKVAHALKGSSLQIGLQSVAELSLKMEEESRTGLCDVEAALDRIRAVADQLAVVYPQPV